MLIEKIKLHNNNNNGENKITFNMEWYMKLLKWKQLDIELFRNVFSTFRNEINTTTPYKFIEIIISSNNSNILKVMDRENEKQMIKQVVSNLNYQFLSSELQLFIIKYGNDDGTYSSLDIFSCRQQHSYYFNQLLSIESIKFIVGLGGTISNDYIQNSMKAMVYIYQVNQVCHFEYIKFIYENYSSKCLVIESLKSIAVKNNDEKVYRLIYANYQINHKDNIKPSHLYKFNDNEGHNKHIQLCDGITVRLSEFLNIPNHILMGKLKSLTDPRFEIVKQLSEQITSTFFRKSRVIEDPYIADYIIENEHLIQSTTNKINNIFASSSLRDDCSNKKYFIEQNRNQMLSLNSISTTYDGENCFPYDQPSYEKVKLMIDSNLTWDYSKYLYFRVVNDNPDLLFKVIHKIRGKLSDLLHQVAKMGLNNNVDEIIKNRTSILYSSRTNYTDHILIENLFISIEKTKSNHLFSQLLKVAKTEGALINRISMVYEKICTCKIPSNQTERSVYLGQINSILNSCTGYDSHESFIKFCCNKLSIHKLHIDRYPFVHCYLLGLNAELVSSFLDDNEISTLVQLVLSTNSELLINEFKYLLNNSNQLDKQTYLKYYSKSINLKSFNYLIQSIELDLFIDLSDLFEYLVKNGVVSFINYFLSKKIFDSLILKNQQHQIGFDYYLCFIHLLIVKNVSNFQSKTSNSIISDLLNRNYSFVPQLVELNQINELVYQICSEKTITKIQSLQNVRSFLKNVGLIQYFKNYENSNNDDQLIIDYSLNNNNLNFNQ